MSTAKKICLADTYLSDSQSILNALPNSLNNNFHDTTWRFGKSRHVSATINFDTFLKIQETFFQQSEFSAINITTISKRMWLESISVASNGRWNRKLKGLALFWMALGELNISKITEDNLSIILSFLLTHQLTKGTLQRRKDVTSYVSFRTEFSFDSWRHTLHSMNIILISPNITTNLIRKALRKIIPSLTNGSLTANDWMKGSSLDFLGLDYGQYYIEHCFDFFNRHITLATAISHVMRNIKNISSCAGTNEATTRKWVINFLDGMTSIDIFEKERSLKRSQPIKTIDRVQFHTYKYFEEAYRKAHFANEMLQDENLSDLIATLGLEIQPAQIDRIRIIVWDWMNHGFSIETENLLATCSPPVEAKRFQEALKTFEARFSSQPCKMPDLQAYEAIGLQEVEKRIGSTYVRSRKLVNFVEQAGLLAIVALTGWRRTEFGFPITAILKFANDDVLDQYSFPFRYQVDWYVYKTSGDVRLKREVTFSIFLFSERLHALIGGDISSPCLYPTRTELGNSSGCATAVNRASNGLWHHYVKNYAGFKNYEDLRSWKEIIASEELGEILSDEHHQKKSHLLTLKSVQEWNELKIDQKVGVAMQRARQELPILDFYFAYHDSIGKTDWLQKYQKRSLKPELLKLLDKHLSQDTRAWINTLEIASTKSPQIKATISSELVGECLYPTPHAFRHIWAEAIYRRFDGDVGWMIRSQFKHISKSMFLHYVRDKDNHRDHQSCKIKVVSSLVFNYLRSKGENYAGQMHIWLRRLIRRTSVMNAEEQQRFVDHIATVEIAEIKTNPWGYCLLKKRTKRKARCAEMGEPQRHNAAPELCLGCPHNLMQSNNIDWIINHLNTHVEALKNPLVPKIFKESSYRLIQLASKHIRTLHPNHEVLQELERLIESRTSMEEK